MAKSKKASARVTAADKAQAAAAAGAKTQTGRRAAAKAASQHVAKQQFDKTRARAIQAHIQSRGQRSQAKRDAR